MTLRNFVQKNREEIDRVIKAVCPNCAWFNDEERRAWIFNDTYLYNLARNSGVRI